MEYFLRFANSSLLFVLIPLVGVISFVRLRWYKKARYKYSMVGDLKSKQIASRHKRSSIFFLLRFFSLIGLAFLIGQPQLVDPHSNILVEGIDMMVVLDVSGSMQFRDYGDQGKSRVDIAKEEAIRFIEKRVHDPIGLVIFGKEAVSRCPITADKQILKSIIQELHIGVIDPDGTVLALGMLTAANRLKDSRSKSKIMIVLTDGEPSPWDESCDAAAEVAKRMGIKIYTIGIGSDKDEAFMHPLYGLVQKPKINSELLSKIATATDGKFFLAQNRDDMRRIYDTIDRLEKTEYETDLFSRYEELLFPFLWIICLFIFLEILLSSLLWFGI